MFTISYKLRLVDDSQWPLDLSPFLSVVAHYSSLFLSWKSRVMGCMLGSSVLLITDLRGTSAFLHCAVHTQLRVTLNKTLIRLWGEDWIIIIRLSYLARRLLTTTIRYEGYTARSGKYM